MHGTALAWSHTDESLGLSEFRSILTTLKYDGFIEETRAIAGARHVEGDPTYRVIGKALPLNSLVAAPCGSCPVRNTLHCQTVLLVQLMRSFDGASV